jgi:hypothetical protein
MNFLKYISISFCLLLVGSMLVGSMQAFQNGNTLSAVCGTVASVAFFILSAFGFVELEAEDENHSNIA